MKKLLFVLAFAFIGQQSFSQICLVTICAGDDGPCPNTSKRTIMTIDPTGTETHICVDAFITNNNTLGQLNQVLNSVTSQGYKLVNFTSNSSEGALTYTINGSDFLVTSATFIFAIP